MWRRCRLPRRQPTCATRQKAIRSQSSWLRRSRSRTSIGHGAYRDRTGPLGVAGAVDLAGVHVERRRHVRVGIALETVYTSSPAAISMPAKLWRQSCRTGFRRPAASRFAFTAAVNAASRRAAGPHARLVRRPHIRGQQHFGASRYRSRTAGGCSSRAVHLSGWHEPSNRRQPFDATFATQPVPQMCLHKEVLVGNGPSQLSRSWPHGLRPMLVSRSSTTPTQRRTTAPPIPRTV